MSLTSKVARNSIIQASGRFAVILIAFISVKLLTNALGPAGYGEYAAILNYISFFGVLADFGFFLITLRELTMAKDQDEADYIVGNVLALRSIFAAIVLLCAVIAVYIVPTGRVPILTENVKLGIFIVAIATFWQTLNGTIVAIFQAHYRMDKPVIAEVVGRILSLVLLVPFLKLHLSVAWLVSAMVWGGLLNFALNVGWAKGYSRVHFRFNVRYWKKIWTQSLVLGIVSILGLIYYKIDGLILSILKTSTEVGIYAAPYKVIEVLNVFPGIFMGLVFVALAKSWTDQRQEKIETLIHRSTEAITIIFLPVLVGGIMLAGPVMTLISSSSYAHYSTFTAQLFGSQIPVNGIVVLQLLLIAVTFDAFGNIFGKSIIAFGHTKLLLWPNVCAVILNIGLNLFLIPKWSYAGAALVTVVTEGFVLAAQIFIMRRFATLQVPWNTLGRVLAAVAIMAVVLWFFRGENALIGAAVGAAVYLGAAWTFGAISKETVSMIWEKG